MGMGNKAIEILLRLVDQASAPFRKASKEVRAGSQEMAQGHEQASTAAGKASEAIKGAGQSSEEAGKKQKQSKKDIDELRQGYQQLAVGAVAVLTAMTMAVNSGIEANNRQVAAFTGLRSIVVGTGNDYDKARTFVEQFTEDGLISQAEAAQSLQKLLSSGYGMQEATDILYRFKDAAAFGRQGTLKLGEAIVEASDGVKNWNSINVDNVGVTKNLSVMLTEHAKKLGKTVTALSEAEKRQAVYNGIMKETTHQVGDAVKLAESFAGMQAKAGKATEEASAALGGAWASALEKVVPLWTSFMNGVKTAIDKYPGLTVAIMAGVGALAALAAAAGVWATVTAPAMMTAMSAVAAKAGIMWAAITGPVGAAVAAIGITAGALYYLSTTQRRAAEAAVESARKQEEAARETAEATRNKVREIIQDEENLQTQIVNLEEQIAKKRAEIARREREERHKQANQFGELIMSALRKKLEQEKTAEEKAAEENLEDLREFHQKRLAEVDKHFDNEREKLEENLDEQERLLDEKYDDLGRRAEQSFRDRLAPIAAEINALFQAEIDALDAAMGGEIRAKQAELDAIDKLTKEENRALRSSKREQRRAELEAKLATLTDAKEILEVREELAEIEREIVLEERDLKKEAIRQQISDLQDSYQERRQAIELAHKNEIDKLYELLGQKKDALDRELSEDLSRLSEGTQAYITEIQTRLSEQLSALSQQETAVKTAYDDELSELKRVKAEELKEIQSNHQQKLADLQETEDMIKGIWQESLDSLTANIEQEKAKIHDKYHGPGGLLEEATLYTQALKLVHDGNQQEILALLETYEPGWQQQGKDFVQRLADGGNEAKPAVEALAEAIDVLLLASTENVLMLQDAANDGAAELAEMVSQLDQAKTKLAEMQQIRRQIESEADAAARAAAYVEYSRARLEEASKDISTKEKSFWDNVMHNIGQGMSGGHDSQFEQELRTQGSRHGGGPVPLSGAYQLLQGEHVLSRAEASAYRAPRLVDAGTIMGGEMSSSPGFASGSNVFNFDFRGSRLTDDRDVEKLMHEISFRLLTTIRQNTKPIR